MINSYFQVEWYRQPRVVAALVFSLLLHGMLVALAPGWRIHHSQPQVVLSVELPAIASPEPAQAVPQPKPQAREKPPPHPVAVERSSSEFVVPKTPETPKELPQPAAPVKETSGEGKSAALEPAKPAVSEKTNPVPESVWLDGYGRTLSTLISRYQRYPHVALLRGWQGTTQLQLILSGSGKMLNAAVLRSSGFEVLDNQALEMVQQAAPFPQPPEALRGRNVTVTVPIVFKLND
ncbi:MAG TPA: energy transducer TonB [Burkholderiales bacterium]|nr:energy transducer TonB [Burkholderiales bacterium]